MFDKKGSGVAFGIIIGSLIGAISGNMGLWLALGVVFGAGYETKAEKNRAKTESDNIE